MGAAVVEKGTNEREPRFRRSPRVQQAEQAGTVVLFDGARYYTLPNEVATDLWLLLAAPRSADELVSLLHQQYEAPREVIASDVSTQLKLLCRARLVIEEPTRP